MIIVPTPVDEHKESDLSAVISASQSIMEGLKEGDLVIIESTVPPGTCENMVIPMKDFTARIKAKIVKNIEEGSKFKWPTIHTFR